MYDMNVIIKNLFSFDIPYICMNCEQSRSRLNLLNKYHDKINI